MFKKMILSLFCFVSTSLFGASPLIVGTNAEFPPYTYIENKTIVGFDIDVAKEVGKRLHRPVEFKDVPFDALIPDLVLGKVDFVAAGMTYTEERGKRVLFTKPYLGKDPFVILSKKNLTLDDLQGKTVVVIEGFTADLFISSKKGINLLRLGNQTDGFLSIKYGRADAFITAKSTVDAFLKTQDPTQFHITIIEGTGETDAIVVPKTKPELLIEIQKALDEMEKDGTMNTLKQKWGLS